MKRRDFFKHGAILGSALSWPSIGCGDSEEQPQSPRPQQATDSAVRASDLALINANVITLDATRPRAQAALIRQGRIVLVGSTQEVRGAAGRDTNVFDAEGKTVVPGFVDGHCHMEVATSAAAYMVSVHTPPATSLSEIVEILRKKAASTPKGEWVIARGSFNIQGNVTEKRLLTLQDLDGVSTEHPLIVFSGRHVAMLNTMAYKTMHLWERDAKIEAGTIVHREPSGRPTGLATEVYYHLPAYSVEQVKTAIKTHVGDMFVSKGTTSIYSIPFSANDIRADLELQHEGALPLRIRTYYHVPHTITLDGLVGSGLISQSSGDMWRFGGMKLFVDGLGGDGLGKRFADFKWTQDELNHLVATATTEGIQVIMHVITPDALKRAVAAIEHARSRSTRSIVHRLEHGADDGPVEELRRLRDLGIRVSITPNRGRPGRNGPRYRTLVKEGFPPIGITDTTGTTPGSSDALFKIACVATSVDEGGGAPADETLPVEDALRMFSLWNAQVGYEDADKGSIEVGKFGDFAVLSRDPTTGSPALLFETKVDATILGGQIVFRR